MQGCTRSELSNLQGTSSVHVHKPWLDLRIECRHEQNSVHAADTSQCVGAIPMHEDAQILQSADGKEGGREDARKVVVIQGPDEA